MTPLKPTPPPDRGFLRGLTFSSVPSQDPVSVLHWRDTSLRARDEVGRSRSGGVERADGTGPLGLHTGSSRERGGQTGTTVTGTGCGPGRWDPDSD